VAQAISGPGKVGLRQVPLRLHRFSHVSIIPPMLHIPTFIYDRRHIILATYSVISNRHLITEEMNTEVYKMPSFKWQGGWKWKDSKRETEFNFDTNSIIMNEWITKSTCTCSHLLAEWRLQYHKFHLAILTTGEYTVIRSPPGYRKAVSRQENFGRLATRLWPYCNITLPQFDCPLERTWFMPVSKYVINENQLNGSQIKKLLPDENI
jgi:hypothetical protein